MKRVIITKKLKIVSGLILVTTLILSGCTTATTTEPLTILTPVNISAEFGGVIINAGGGRDAVTVSGTTIVITGFRNAPDVFNVVGMVTITSPAGYTADLPSISFTDINGYVAGSSTDPYEVTVSSDTGSQSLTYAIQIEFGDGTPTLAVANSSGFGDINEVALSLDTATTSATVTPCALYNPTETLMLGGIAASKNYVVALASTTPQADSYHDAATAANNTNRQTYQVTYGAPESTSPTLAFAFTVVIEECSPGTVLGGMHAGTEADPWQAGDARSLQSLAFFANQNAHDAADSMSAHYYELTDNIDLSTITSGGGFVPIGEVTSEGKVVMEDKRFAGVFDCKGYTISGLTINRPQSDYQGLFGYVQSTSESSRTTVKNCRLMGVDVTGRDGVGALVGAGVSGVILSNIFVEGNVTGRDSVGGVAGTLRGSFNELELVGARAVVDGDQVVGGLVGFANRLDVKQSYFNGTVTGTFFVGGILGQEGGGLSYTNIYARGTVTGANATGGLIGNTASGGTASTPIKYGVSFMTVTQSPKPNDPVPTDPDADDYRTTNSDGTAFIQAAIFTGNRGAAQLRYLNEETPNDEETPNVRIGAIAGEYGQPPGQPPTVTSSYVDTNLSDLRFIGSAKRTDPPLAGVTGLTTTELQAPTAPGTVYVGWDDTIWDFGTSSQYPVLILPANSPGDPMATPPVPPSYEVSTVDNQRAAPLLPTP